MTYQSQLVEWFHGAVQQITEIPFDTLGNLILVGIPVWILLYAWWTKREEL